MEQDIKVTSNTLVKVKEIVDFLFEATVTEGGYKGGWSKYSTRFRKIAHILVKRGVLIKEGNQMHTTYKWNNAAMCPTKPFYKSVAQEMVKDERAVMARSYQKKKQTKAAEERKAAEEASKSASEAPESRQVSEVEEILVNTEKVLKIDPFEGPDRPTMLQYFSDQDLWDELKRRGARIVGGTIKMVKEIELA